MTIQQAKEKLRQELRCARLGYHRKVNPLQEGIALLVQSRKTLFFQNPSTLGGYDPQGSEINCLPLLMACAKQGFNVGFPHIQEQNLVFYKRQPGHYGKINKESGQKDFPFDPDVLIVPLIGFDHLGYRLGQGGGFYDRTIDRLTEKNPTLVTIGLAYDCQKVERVPVEPHDQKLTAVITPSTFYLFN